MSYQRFIKGPKLSKMRDYLAENGKVFINNLIVTLPSTVTMVDESGKSVDPKKLPQKEGVKLHLPHELGTVGIVDGQHRIFAYFDGSDANNAKIAPLRSRQNLLVTGIIFPSDYDSDERVKFEAELFLSINNTQTAVKSDLRQELETLIRPDTPEAIAKAFVTALSRTGPLKGLIQETLNDPGDRIRSASLVKFPALQMVRPDEKNGLFQLWRATSILPLSSKQGRESYIGFCLNHANRMLSAVRDEVKHARWQRATKAGNGILSPTTIGGLLLVVKQLADEGAASLDQDYKARLGAAASFDFNQFTSSTWGGMAAAFKEQFFS